ncbi:FecR domain-containing protein [Oxalicibacterium faecigallinarum]|uniref:FecR domain-containing protein n=1 Tax=Oxalicibacterium faecigallinarum TaxID=573741 RepID=UPI001E508322|nr:FecR domain-containing protein [Oxalicibacterium faecigallinarum]
MQQQAAEWLVELQSADVADETRQRWQQWRDAHSDHAHAWQRIEAFGERLQGLSSPLAHAALTQPKTAGRRRAVKTLAIMLFAGSTTWLVGREAPIDQWTADRRTGVGERTRITLDDGTQLQLNAETAINIEYTETQRLVRLVRGELLVVTAPDPLVTRSGSRPFLIETAHGKMRALGTRFLVQQRDDQQGHSLVAVYEGAVEVRPGHVETPRIVRDGQQTSFSQDRFEEIEEADDNAIAWTDGMLVVRDMPLGAFLQALGPHRRGYLGCDATVANLKVTGTYPLADTDKILDMLRKTLPVDIRFVTRYWVKVEPTRT